MSTDNNPEHVEALFAAVKPPGQPRICDCANHATAERSAQPVTREDDTTRTAVAAAVLHACPPINNYTGPEYVADAALAAVWATPPPWLIDLVRSVDGRLGVPDRRTVSAAVPESLRLAAGIQP